jgi:hypothetical protein
MALYTIQRAWRNANFGFLAVHADGREWVLKLPWSDLAGLTNQQRAGLFRTELIRRLDQDAESAEQALGISGTIEG